jgi:hypothetical protein
MDWSQLLRIGGLVLLDLVLLAGLLAVPLGLSGNFIILGAALVTALATGFSAVGWEALAVMAGLVVAGEIAEALLGALVARKFGATKWGMSGALLGGWGGALAGGFIGGALGTLFLPVVGTLIGSFAGTALGAVLLEIFRGGGTRDGARAGLGAFVGKVLASSFKLAIGVGMAVYLVIRVH